MARGDGTNDDDGPGPAPPAAREPVFTVGASDRGTEIDLDLGSVTFGGFEWAVPALVMSVPGILIILVAAQMLMGIAWLPVARRWLGSDRRLRRHRPTRAVSSG